MHDQMILTVLGKSFLIPCPWRNRHKPGIVLKLPGNKQPCLMFQRVSPCSDLQCHSDITEQRFINRPREHRLCPWDEICCSPGRADRHYLCLTSLACDVAALACLNSIKPLLFALRARACLRKLVPRSGRILSQSRGTQRSAEPVHLN